MINYLLLWFCILLFLSNSPLNAQSSAEYSWPEWAIKLGLDIPGPYIPTWESLDSHPLPEWFLDAKIENNGFNNIIAKSEYSGQSYYPTKFTRFNTFEQEPYRDITGEGVKNAQQNGIYAGIYYPFDTSVDPVVEYPELAKGGDYIIDFVIPQLKEIIDLYDPYFFFFDLADAKSADYWHTRELLAYFYNKAEAEGRQVWTNNRIGGDAVGHSDFPVVEPVVPSEILSDPWIAATLPAGHDRDPDYTSAIEKFVDIVCRGGIAMPWGGRFRTDALLSWLEINSEAVYFTRPWISSTEGNIRFTRNKRGDLIYAIFYEWPKEGVATIKSMKGQAVIDVQLIGFDRPINWSLSENGLSVGFPDTAHVDFPYNTGFTYRIQLDKTISIINPGDIAIGKIQLSKNIVNSGESFDASVIIVNNGDSSGLATIELLIDGEHSGSVPVFAENGIGKRKISKKVSLPVIIHSAGEHMLSLRVGESITDGKSVQVKAPEFPY